MAEASPPETPHYPAPWAPQANRGDWLSWVGRLGFLASMEGKRSEEEALPRGAVVRGEGKGVGIGVCRNLRGPGSRSFRNTHVCDRHIQLSKENLLRIPRTPGSILLSPEGRT